ncbi:MAG: Chemotaxis protein CheW [Clostridiales bacterium]|jgi:purine-binding chemotaxis protein CheW|nr:Chemotaxis protein CheW [Clostridiales bacterium]
MASRQLVIFKVNNEDFGVEISQVSSIEKPMEIFKVPNTPEYIEGLINLRGKVHTVFNLRKKFNFPIKEWDDNTKIVITSVNNLNLGFIVDEVNEIMKIEDESIEKAPGVIDSIDSEYLKGVAKLQEKLVLLLDLSRVLTSSESAAVENLQKNI